MKGGVGWGGSEWSGKAQGRAKVKIPETRMSAMDSKVMSVAGVE